MDALARAEPRRRRPARLQQPLHPAPLARGTARAARACVRRFRGVRRRGSSRRGSGGGSRARRARPGRRAPRGRPRPTSTGRSRGATRARPARRRARPSSAPTRAVPGPARARPPGGSHRPGAVPGRADGTRGRASPPGIRARAAVEGRTAPGAGSPWASTSDRWMRRASFPAIFCSRIAGTRTSRIEPVRDSRRPGNERASRRMVASAAARSPGRSSSPARPGAAAIAASAPGPWASASRTPSPRTSRSEHGPSGVRQARTALSRATRMVGSAVPRRSGHSVRARSSGWSNGKERRSGAVDGTGRTLPPPGDSAAAAATTRGRGARPGTRRSASRASTARGSTGRRPRSRWCRRPFAWPSR